MLNDVTAAPAAARKTPPLASSGLAFHVALTGLINLAVFLIWALTGGGYFWPVWVALGLGTPVLVHLSIRRAMQEPAGRVRNLTMHGLLTAVYWLFSFLTWAVTGGGYFWPVYSMVVTGLAVAFHALFAFQDRLPVAREAELTERVDELTRTRAGALDVQAAELRRIERDLHDGAQARLVALSMKLGRAERRLEDDTEVAELLREAREEAGHAISELRDLARGIAPPILADRGLVAAVETLANRAPIPTTVDASLDTRPVPVVEAAAYFVVAESLTNAAKHAAQRHRPRDAAPVRRLAADRRRRRRARRRRPRRQRPGRAAPSCRGAGRLARGDQPGRRRHDDPRGAALRVVVAEDLALLREGLVALLREHDIDVVAQAEDAPGLLRVVAGHKPDVAIVDVRLPPTFTDEGIRAAIEARRRQPGLGVLILSAYVEPVYSSELLAGGEGGIGYLLKERVGDVREFLDAIDRVAAGGTALDREVVAELMRARTGGRDDALGDLTPREREVLELMAEGRTNAAIARALVVQPGAVEKHISSIFGKLGLAASDNDHRRVLAVLAYLRAGGEN